MKLHARFTALYGWCPPVRGLSRGEVELGLMVNMNKVQAIQNLALTEGVGCAFDGEALADLAERAGVPEKDVVRLRVQSMRDKMSNDTGAGQWQ